MAKGTTNLCYCEDNSSITRGRSEKYWVRDLFSGRYHGLYYVEFVTGITTEDRRRYGAKIRKTQMVMSWRLLCEYELLIPRQFRSIMLVALHHAYRPVDMKELVESDTCRSAHEMSAGDRDAALPAQNEDCAKIIIFHQKTSTKTWAYWLISTKTLEEGKLYIHSAV